MESPSDQELLRAYAESGAEPAFSEVVRRHVDFVFSVALRAVRDAHLAEDVTQSVFLELARNARRVSIHPVLAGWLHRATRNLAANAIRAEVRRQAREKEAAAMNDPAAGEAGWEQIAPHLDAVLDELPERDRDVVLLRYFQHKSAREMAETLAVSESAAQKRLSRAMERLRALLRQRGIHATAPALAICLPASGVQAAPAGLASSISAALIQPALHQAITAGAGKAITMTTAQKTIVAVALSAAVGTGIYEFQQNASRVREAQAFAAHAESLERRIGALEDERDEAGSQLAALRQENERLLRAAAEVHKLRGDLTQARAEAEELARQLADVPAAEVNATEATLVEWLDRTEGLKQLQRTMPERTIPEMQLLTEEDWLELARQSLGTMQTFDLAEETVARKALSAVREKAKRKFQGSIYRALREYLAAHEGVLPADTMALKPYFEWFPESMDATLGRYEFLQTGRFDDFPTQDVVILAEKAPVDPDYDTRLEFGRHWMRIDRIAPPAPAEGQDSGHRH